MWAIKGKDLLARLRCQDLIVVKIENQLVPDDSLISREMHWRYPKNTAHPVRHQRMPQLFTTTAACCMNAYPFRLCIDHTWTLVPYHIHTFKI